MFDVPPMDRRGEGGQPILERYKWLSGHRSATSGGVR